MTATCCSEFAEEPGIVSALSDTLIGVGCTASCFFCFCQEFSFDPNFILQLQLQFTCLLSLSLSLSTVASPSSGYPPSILWISMRNMEILVRLSALKSVTFIFQLLRLTPKTHAGLPLLFESLYWCIVCPLNCNFMLLQ